MRDSLVGCAAIDCVSLRLAIAFCALNAVAWKRWPVRKWGLWSIAILVVTSTLYVADYFTK